MSNKEIIRLFRKTADLLLLHGENEFKAKAYQSAVFKIESAEKPLIQHTDSELQALGFSKSLIEKLRQIAESGSFTDLDELLEKTPSGLVGMLSVQGLGAKKVRTLWQELGIETLSELLRACQEGHVEKLKGFGKKTQTKIEDGVRYLQAQQGRFLFAEAEPFAQFLEEQLSGQPEVERCALVGQLRRQLPVIDELSLVVATKQRRAIRDFLNQLDDFTGLPAESSPFIWRGYADQNRLKVAVRLVDPTHFTQEVLLRSGAEEHFRHMPAGTQETLFARARKGGYDSEEAFYQELGWSYLPAPLREGQFELAAQEQTLPESLLQPEDIRGILHAHSTYSDGKHTLRQMAEACRDAGYQYLGITDHSQTAYYAGGLKPEDVLRQHEEIEQLNAELAPFRIFKGIESDILGDGSLDYEEDILARFDFVIASVHANLRMSQEKATERLLRAIENPYTTILGHLTGRLLLKREGYPLDMERILDACAAHQVVIEINAHPQRLDLDWQWVRPALERGIQLSVNPDAHEVDGIHHIRYGTLVGQKGGLTPRQTLNTQNVTDLDHFFAARKEKLQRN